MTLEERAAVEKIATRINAALDDLRLCRVSLTALAKVPGLPGVSSLTLVAAALTLSQGLEHVENSRDHLTELVADTAVILEP